MKNLKLLLLAASLLCAPLATVHAITYRYDFTVFLGVAPLPPGDAAGYLDLTAPSGANVASGTAIADWSLITPFGTLNNGNSSIFNTSSLLSWNSSTITGIVLQGIQQQQRGQPATDLFSG